MTATQSERAAPSANGGEGGPHSPQTIWHRQALRNGGFVLTPMRFLTPAQAHHEARPKGVS